MIGRLLAWLFSGLNNMALIMLWACIGLTYLDCSLVPKLAVFTLSFPILLLVNLLFIPFWLVFRPKLVLVPAVGVGLAFSFVMDYFPMNISSSDAERDSTTLRVMTWNVANFDSISPGSEEAIFAYLDSVDADVLCLQECAGGKIAPRVQEHMQGRGYEWLCLTGRTLYSRLPILSSSELLVPSYKANGVMTCQLLWGTDTIALFNAHLESNFLYGHEIQGGKDALRSKDSEQIRAEGKHIWDKLAMGQTNRGTQTKALCEAVDQCRHTAIVAGDFNDTPISYPYQQMARRMKSAYRERGAGLGVSYNERYFLFRIDHLFHSDALECSAATIDDRLQLSDHYPLIADLRRR